MSVSVSAIHLGVTRRRRGGWLSSQIAALTAADGTKPAAIADFENWRFAITTVAVGDVPSASAADLQVLEECTFADWFAYTASSTTARTYTNASGAIANDLAADAPRRDYSAEASRLLLENAATNLLTYSEQFDNAAWTKDAGVTVTANAAVAPDGTTTADRVQFSGVDNQIVQSLVASSGIYTTSIYIKGTAGQTIRVSSLAGSTTDFVLTGEWDRVPNTSTTTTTPRLSVSTFGGVTARDIYIWGAQVELGSFASSYIPTVASTVTRAIETARFSPLLEAILQRSAASVLVRTSQIKNPSSHYPRFIAGSGLVAPIMGDASATRITAYNGTTSLPNNLASGSWQTAFGAAAGFNSSGRSISGNGATPSTDANTVGSLSTVYLGRSAGAGATEIGNGLYKLVAIYPTRLSDASLQALAVA